MASPKELIETVNLGQRDGWAPLDVDLRLIDGDPRPTGLLVHESDADRGVLMVGFAEVQPSTFEVTIDFDESIHAIEGEALIAIDGATEVTLEPGVATHIPRGSHCRWTVVAPFREFFVISR